MAVTPLRPALRYYGSKWRLAPFIVKHFPPHTCYVEPFGGSAAVLLQKPPSYLEVYNDADEQVVTFFRILRERPEELIRAIERTPFSRVELDLAYQYTEDELEQARRFYVRSWQSRAGPSCRWRGGWYFERSGSRGKPLIASWNETEHLWRIVDRLKQVSIECDDALQVVARYDAPGTLFYVDPPYPKRTRTRWASAGYRHEMSDQDHAHLAEVLQGIQGMAVVSSYPSALYDDLYCGWHKAVEETRTSTGQKAMEVLWISSAAELAALPLLALIQQG